MLLLSTEICEDTEFPRPYMMKRPDPHESFYAATDIIHHVSFLYILLLEGQTKKRIMFYILFNQPESLQFKIKGEWVCVVKSFRRAMKIK